MLPPLVDAAGRTSASISVGQLFSGTEPSLQGVTVNVPHYLAATASVSDDPQFVGGALWGLEGPATAPSTRFGSAAAEAWAAGLTGSLRVAIGVVDSGIDYTHPDLYQNVWLNNREISGEIRARIFDADQDGIFTFRDLNAAQNSVLVSDVNRNGYIDGGDILHDPRWADGSDTDGNAYVDDLIGWDFANNDNDPYDDRGHGTHVAGIIGAAGGNGVGVVGVNWNVRLIPLKFIAANGVGATADAVKALDYYTAAAATASSGEALVATNNSWSTGGYSAHVAAAIARGAAQNVLFVTAAGNEHTDTNLRVVYPSSYSTSPDAAHDLVLSVAALGPNGRLASFSNFGATGVDVAAPGTSILSTLPGANYGLMSGTSQAAAFVSGAIALLASADPSLGATALKATILGTAAGTPGALGLTLTSGRLDIGAMLGIDAAPLGAAKVAGASGENAAVAAEAPYSGPVSGLVYSYLGSGGSEVIVGNAGAEFINALGGDDAVDANGGNDVVDGGTGSNFLTGGPGTDVFFLDGRGYSTTWSTITDWSPEEQLSLFGYQAGRSVLIWEASAGADSYKGMTLHADLNGDGTIETSVTWTDLDSVAQLPTPKSFDGLLWFT
jgi:subtilisin family serine protease